MRHFLTFLQHALFLSSSLSVTADYSFMCRYPKKLHARSLGMIACFVAICMQVLSTRARKGVKIEDIKIQVQPHVPSA